MSLVDTLLKSFCGCVSMVYCWNFMLMSYVCIFYNEKYDHTLTYHRYKKTLKQPNQNLRQFSQDFAMFQNDQSYLICPVLHPAQTVSLMF